MFPKNVCVIPTVEVISPAQTEEMYFSFAIDTACHDQNEVLNLTTILHRWKLLVSNLNHSFWQSCVPCCLHPIETNSI